MKLRFIIKTIYNTFDKDYHTVESNDQFDAARELHDFLIESRYIKDCGDIAEIQITAHEFRFVTSLPDNSIFQFTK